MVYLNIYKLHLGFKIIIIFIIFIESTYLKSNIYELSMFIHNFKDNFMIFQTFL